ncbi:MAG TPA: hypothetical protein PKH69_06635 [Thiobacillaceae bacterium]|nr:hypothetical protein [Thiobacillaceae bacterium]HNU63832.1 hypothetical protein [Thiobacillaceae bacterium]
MGLSILLAGCGAETVGTTAVRGTLGVQEAEQARQTQEDVARRLDAARQLGQQRLEEGMRAPDQPAAQ